MRRKQIIRLYAVLLISLAVTGVRAEENVPSSNVVATFKAVKERAITVAKQWNQSVDFDKKYTVYYEENDTYYHQPYFEFRDLHKWYFQVLADGRLIRYLNSIPDHSKLTGLDQPTKPDWDEKKAVEVASEFVRQMLGEMPREVAPGKATYRSQKTNGKYVEGEWRVEFRRIDPATGYYFDPLEAIRVYIYEKKGPCGLYVQMPSQFTKIDFTPLSKEECVDAAYREALRMTRSKQLLAFFDQGKYLKEHAKANLMIIKPNRFGETDIRAVTPEDLNARLAWVVWFPWQPDGKTIDPEHPSRSIGVYIDAQNKKWLGGDSCF